MNGLKLLTLFFLLFLVLLSRPSAELCIYNGSVDIASHNLNSTHSHCSSDSDVNQKSKVKVEQKQKCCIDIKLSETQSNISPIRGFLDFQFPDLPIGNQNYFNTLNNHFPLNKRVIQADSNLFTNTYEVYFQKSPAFQFTNTILLLI